MVSQGFGANPGFYADPKYGGIKAHNGIDFRAGHGTPVYATHDGTATYEVDPAGGCGVVVVSKDSSYKTIYWHFCPKSDPQFKSPIEGSVLVEMGDIIGYADNTGASTGDHLHFGLKLCLNGVTINTDNGYLGAIDPTPYFDGNYPKTVFLLTSLIDLYKKLIALLTKSG